MLRRLALLILMAEELAVYSEPSVGDGIYLQEAAGCGQMGVVVYCHRIAFDILHRVFAIFILVVVVVTIGSWTFVAGLDAPWVVNIAGATKGDVDARHFAVADGARVEVAFSDEVQLAHLARGLLCGVSGELIIVIDNLVGTDTRGGLLEYGSVAV